MRRGACPVCTSNMSRVISRFLPPVPPSSFCSVLVLNLLAICAEQGIDRVTQQCIMTCCVWENESERQSDDSITTSHKAGLHIFPQYLAASSRMATRQFYHDLAESGRITIFFLTVGLALSPSSFAMNAESEPCGAAHVRVGVLVVVSTCACVRACVGVDVRVRVRGVGWEEDEEDVNTK
jgi:hypothetical protein